jgi:hydroxylamine dehydrogenase
MVISKQTLVYTTGTFLIALSFLLPLNIVKADNHLGGDPAGEACIECHRSVTPGIYSEWNKSSHGQHNTNCYDCHKAEPTDIDAFEHNGALISVIVTPKDCANCHEQEVQEFDRSHHAKGGDILASADNVLGEVLGGPAAVTVGCEQCHGSKIEVDEQGKPAAGWPNTGIGRLNPDGTKGACTACHARHGFSKAQARQPEGCGKCHLGPDHPQLEVYNESKHGIIFHAKKEEMNLESHKWVAGIDYSVAPTCATCHMSAAPGIAITHDVGERVSWNLRAPISSKKNMVRLDNGTEYDVAEGNPLPEVGTQPDDPKAGGGTVTEILTWEDRRGKMQTVCRACHTTSYINSHYENLDNFVVLYNDKFAKPTSAIMTELSETGATTPTAFDDWIEWIWWELWHHEGRRARTGAAMSGPDYAWWHGIYDVAKHFYMEFLPELAELVGEAQATLLEEKYLKPIEGHNWYFEAKGETVTRGNTLPTLESQPLEGDRSLIVEGGISVGESSNFARQVEVSVSDTVDVRVKIQIDADTVTNIKVPFKFGEEEGTLIGTNASSTWTVENGEVVIWDRNTAIPEVLKGNKLILYVEVENVRTSQGIEVTID